MPELKGKTTFKATADIKAGEEVVIEQTFDADQAHFDQLVVDRVNRARKEKEDEVTALKKKLEEAGTRGGGETATLKAQLETQQAELETMKRNDQLTKAQRAVGALDLEEEFLATVKVEKDDTDAMVQAKVKAAVKRRADILKAAGAPEGGKAGAGQDGGTGREGAGGSRDEEPEDKKFDELHTKFKNMRPDLLPWINKGATKAAQMKLMQKYEADGMLKPKGSK